jgi:hypothetical protein
MIWNRRLMAGIVVVGLGTVLGTASAQDATPKKDEPAAPRGSPQEEGSVLR